MGIKIIGFGWKPSDLGLKDWLLGGQKWEGWVWLKLGAEKEIKDCEMSLPPVGDYLYSPTV